MTDNTQKTHIKIINHYIKDLSIENPEYLRFFSSEEKRAVGINYNINYKQYTDNDYEVFLSFYMKIQNSSTKGKGDDNSLDNDNSDDKVIYLMELVYAGVFFIDSKDAEQIQKSLLTQCPSILFPYVRQIVLDSTFNSGIKPIRLDMLDFEKMYQEKKEKQEL